MYINDVYLALAGGAGLSLTVAFIAVLVHKLGR